MNGCMTLYYFYRDILNSLPSSIRNEMPTDSSLQFNFSKFLDLGYFFKYDALTKDKYELDKKLNSNEFYPFFIDCCVEISKNIDYQGLAFLYAILASYKFKSLLTPYLETKVTDDQDLDDIFKMLDYHYSRSRDSIDLTKRSISSVFPNGFETPEFIYKLVHTSCIRNYKLFLSENYFNKCQKNKHHFYKYLTHTNSFYTPFIFMHNALFVSKKKKKLLSYRYNNKVDTTILNKAKEKYIIDDEEYSYTLDEQINLIKQEVLEEIRAINLYIFEKKEKDFRKIFKIESEKKL